MSLVVLPYLSKSLFGFTEPFVGLSGVVFTVPQDLSVDGRHSHNTKSPKFSDPGWSTKPFTLYISGILLVDTSHRARLQFNVKDEWSKQEVRSTPFFMLLDARSDVGLRVD